MARKAIVYALFSALILLNSCGTAPASPTTFVPTPEQSATESASGTAVTSKEAASSLTCPDASEPIQGSIVFVGDGNLIAIDQDGNDLQQLTTLPTAQWSQHPVWSPDAQTLAYTLNVQNPNEALAWLPVSIICGLDRGTGKGRILAQAEEHEAFSEPAWTSDGKALYLSWARHSLDANNQYLGTDTEVGLYNMTTNTTTTVAKNSSGAALSHDGKQLAYIYNNPETFELQLMLANPDGQDPQAVVATGGEFGTILGASWTADGAKLLFAASGGSTARQIPRPDDRPLWERLAGISVARAHGAPMDLWSVDADGKNLQQLTAKKYDDPRATWGPDGQHIAIVTNGGGVLLLNVADRTERQITDRGNFGGITWASR